MPTNPTNGVYTMPENTYSNPSAGLIIADGPANQTNRDLENALTTRITSNGKTPISSDLRMDGNRHTNVGDALQTNQYAAAHQVAEGALTWSGDALGGGELIDIKNTWITQYVPGMRITFRATNANATATPTLRVNDLDYKAIKNNDGSDVAPGAFVPGMAYDLVYDGTVWLLMKYLAPLPSRRGQVKERIGFYPTSNLTSSAFSGSFKVGDNMIDNYAGTTITVVPLIQPNYNAPTSSIILENNYLYDFILVAPGYTNSKYACIYNIDDLHFKSDGDTSLNGHINISFSQTETKLIVRLGSIVSSPVEFRSIGGTNPTWHSEYIGPSIQEPLRPYFTLRTEIYSSTMNVVGYYPPAYNQTLYYGGSAGVVNSIPTRGFVQITKKYAQ